MLSNHQHGFRANRFCLTALLEYFEDITRLLDENLSIDAVYLDYQKAFDAVPIKGLLVKVEAVGIGDRLLNWIKGFLSDHEQHENLRGEFSPRCKVYSGVPQGSVLGPVLFLIYVNDIVMAIDSTIKLFADDVKIYCAIRSPNNLISLQSDLNCLSDWSEKWLLKFNAQKCKVMHFGHLNTKHVYDLNNIPLDPASEERTS